jgi:alanine racemase
MVRPGIALYGGSPMPGRGNPMRPVVTLKVRVLQVRNVARNGSVGYGATWTCQTSEPDRGDRAGYADGILRAEAMTENGPGREVVVHGKRCRIVGRVSMDLMTVDVTDLPEGAVRRDQTVTLIGDGITVDEVAAQTGTISYEVLTGLGRRYHRDWNG